MKNKRKIFFEVVAILVLLGVMECGTSITYISGEAGNEYINTTNFHGIYDWTTTSNLYLKFNGTMLDFNDTLMNLTIDARITGGDSNASNCADGEYLDGSGLCVNFNDTADDRITAVDTNCSADMSCDNILYDSEVINVTVNKSLYWDDLDDSSDITILGTIITGLWEATAIVDEFLANINVTKLLNVFLLADTHTHDYTNITNEPWIEDTQEADLNVNSSNQSDKWDDFDSPIDLANTTNLYCGNITGGDYDLCVNPDTNISNTNTNCSVDGSCSGITYDSELTYAVDTNASRCSDGEYLDGSGLCINFNNTADDRSAGFDTNASSICAGATTYLSGEGACNDIALVYLGITDQRFNETTEVNALDGQIQGVNASKLNITDQRYNDTVLAQAVNESAYTYVDSKLNTTYYNATNITVITGTVAGTLEDINIFNGGGYNISEVDSDFDFRVNFTNVTDLNQVVYRYKGESNDAHIMHSMIWSYDDNDWHGLAEEGAREHYGIFTYFIYDKEEHISDGTVQLRFYTTNPPPNKVHKWQFDWITVASGPATPSSSESDPFSVRKDGTTPLTANWDAGSFNITAVTFIGVLIGTANSSNYWDGFDSPIDLVNTTNLYCGNITGADFDLCSNPDTNITDTDTNCSVDMSCDTVLYDSEVINATSNKTLYWDDLNSPIDLANSTNLYCGNITGADFDLCINPDTNISNTNTNCSVDGVCDPITYDSELSYTVDTNETTRVENIVGTECTAGDYINNFSDDGTPQCGTPAGGGDILGVYTHGLFLMNGSATGSVYLEFNTTYANTYYYNQTDANSTFLGIIDQRFNETIVVQAINTTMQAINTSTNINSLFADDLSVDADTNIQMATGSIYLYNDSTIHYFNDTILNITIGIVSAGFDTNASSICAGATTYLSGDGVCVDISGVYLGISAQIFNETIIVQAINETMQAINTSANINSLFTDDLTSDADTNLQMTTNMPYLYNDSTTHYFNDTKLNLTISSISAGFDTNASSICAGATTYLSGDGTCVDIGAVYLGIADQIFNETTILQAVNETMQAINTSANINSLFADDLTSDADTNIQMIAKTPYLYNDSTTHYFNDTKMNETIVVVSAGVDTNCSVDMVCSTVTYDSEIINLTANKSIYWNDFNLAIDLANTTNLYCGNITGADYDLCSNPDTNISDTNIQMIATGKYLYNDSTTHFFNDTILNITIGIVGAGFDTNASSICDGATTYLSGAGTCVEIGAVYLGIADQRFNETTVLQAVNATMLAINTTANINSLFTDDLTSDDDTNIQMDTNMPYLYNDSTTHYFNDTKLNLTIVANLGSFDTNASQCGDGEYLDGSGLCINFNNTVDDRDNNTNIVDDSLYNTTAMEEQDGGILGILDTFVNNLIDNKVTQAFISALEFFTKAETQTLFVNRTNWTSIDDYPAACGAGEYASEIGDTLTCSVPPGTNIQMIAGGEYLYNDSTTHFFNDTMMNLTIGVISSGVDTNASSICAGATTYLSGEGTCVDVSVVYLGIADQRFNETTIMKEINATAQAINATMLAINTTANINSLFTDDLTVDVDTKMTTDGVFMYNDSTTHYGNSTYINATITAIASTYDTNASSICAGTTTYLDGEGNCDDISSVYIDDAGDTMTGDFAMGGFNITDVGNLSFNGGGLIYFNGSHLILT